MRIQVAVILTLWSFYGEFRSKKNFKKRNFPERNIVIKRQFKIALYNYQFIDKRFNYRIIVPYQMIYWVNKPENEMQQARDRAVKK